ncbi:putative dsRNA-binding protein [Pseudonocardia alni]|uniref:putative dsRNA-binding protein n=1 Tax=Pseudonocardia alni TaxID=33907 RepID=UPI00332F8F02
MTSYSFGWRWVGITALREPPAAEPLHRMALRLRDASHSPLVSVAGSDIGVDELLRLLGSIRYRAGLSGFPARAQECLRIEQAIRAGRSPNLRPWLRTKIAEAQGRAGAPRRRTAPSATAPPRSGPAQASTRPGSVPAGPGAQLIETSWATACPEAPDSPWLPPIAERLTAELARLGLTHTGGTTRWIRWACLHSSFLYEQVLDPPVSSGALDLLAALGKGWLRISILDRVRSQRGDFVSNREVSRVLGVAEGHARSLIGEWVARLDAGLYGQGERAQLEAGHPSRAPEAVGLQILGALSLVTGSQAPVDALLETLAYEPPSPEPEWQALLTAALRQEPTYELIEHGADHEKTFTAVVTAEGRSARASGRSKKAARKSAQKEYVLRHLRRTLPDPTPVEVHRPLPYPAASPDHTQAVRWAAQAFETFDLGLMAQALTHRSWVYENQERVSHAGQRDYGTLATEGAEILTTLVRHAHALQVLNATTTPDAHHVNPNVDGEHVALLFDAMPVSAGLLRSSGLRTLSTDVRADVAQAIVAAAWRANGDRLAERQPAVFATWLSAFRPPDDPTTELQEYCARARIAFDITYERRGVDHQAEFRATFTLQVEGTPSWRGDWSTGKTPAKHSAAATVLAAVVETPTVERQGEQVGGADAVIRRAFVAELRGLDPTNVLARRDLATGTAAVDRLAVGDYPGFTRWAAARSKVLREPDVEPTGVLVPFYESVLRAHRRDLVSTWIIEHSPGRGGRVADPAERIRAWWAGPQPGYLALVGDLLAALRKPDRRTAVLDFVRRQAVVAADAARSRLEIQSSSDVAGVSISVRIPGTNLDAAFDPVVRVVDLAGLGVRWTRDEDAVAALVPALPDAVDAIAAAGLRAIGQALADSWLADVENALGRFLAVTEDVFGAPGAVPSPARMNELSLAELGLILHLRGSDERGV